MNIININTKIIKTPLSLNLLCHYDLSNIETTDIYYLSFITDDNKFQIHI